MAVNKVIYGSNTLIDLTGDTVAADKLLQGYTAHNAAGLQITGTAQASGGSAIVITDESDSHGGTIRHINAVSLDGDTVTAGSMLSGVTAHDENGNEITGTIPTKTSSNLTVSGATVTVPAGYYATAASKSVASGSATTPTTTITSKPTITVDSSGLITATNNFSQNVTPTVTAGYISSGTAGTITVSGSKTSQLITQAATTITPTETAQTAVASGKYTTGNVTVAAIDNRYVGSGINRYDTDDLQVTGATVMVPAGYYAEGATAIIPSGSATAPATISGTSATVSTGTNTLTLSKTVSVTPVVSAGYVTSGTAGNSSVSLTASVTTRGAQTITPGTTDQTIASGTYLTGAQTISGDANQVAANIVSGTNIFGVNGSAQLPVVSQDSQTGVLSIS